MEMRKNIKKFLSGCFVITTVFAFMGCDKFSNENKDNVSTTPIISREAIALDVFSTFDLDVSGATEVIWSSENESIATVDADGIVMGVMEGSTNIFATIGDYVLKCAVTVRASENIPSIWLQEEEIELLINEQYTLTPKVLYNQERYDGLYTFNTLNDSVATIDENGTITAHGYGVTKIEISANWGAYTDSIYLKKIITVSVKENVTLKITTASVFLNPTQKVQVGVIAQYNGNDVLSDVVWESSDVEIATIDSTGELTAGNKFGTTQIFVKYTTPNATYTSLPLSVTVEKPVVDLSSQVIVDFDLSKQSALSISDIDEIDGIITKVVIDDKDITNELVDNKISYEQALSYSLGRHKLMVETTSVRYSLELTIASYVISDTESMDAWYTEVKTIQQGGKPLYVVVSDDFTYTGEGLTVWPGETGVLTGTFDGRGHIIKNIRIAWGAMFSMIGGTIKNVAFVDMQWGSNNTSQVGILAKWMLGGARLSNVYISGTKVAGNGTMEDIISIDSSTATNPAVIENCIFNLTTVEGKAMFYGQDGIASWTDGKVDTQFNNVYAISKNTSLANGVTGNVYGSASTDFLSEVETKMANTLFSVEDFGVSFNGKRIIEGVKEKVTLDAMDYDLSKGSALSIADIDGVEGTITKVMLGNTDITEDLAEGIITYEKMLSYGQLGVTTLTLRTTKEFYAIELTIASYVISDTESMDAWYAEVQTIKADGKALYVVVSADFTYTGAGLTVWPSDTGVLTGTFDGRGHIIKNVKIGWGAMFSQIAGTIKNVAFVDMQWGSNNTSQVGILARWILGGARLSNVYISGTKVAGNGTMEDIIAIDSSTAANPAVIENCIFNLTTVEGKAMFYGQDGIASWTDGKVDTQFNNVYAISKNTSLANGVTGNVYGSASTDFLSEVETKMANTLFSISNGKLYFNEKLIIE